MAKAAQPTIDGVRRPLGYEKLTVAATAVGLVDIPSGASVALLCVEGADIRWQDADDPTATDGMPLYDGMPFLYTGSTLGTLKFIRQGSTSGTLHVSYYD